MTARRLAYQIFTALISIAVCVPEAQAQLLRPESGDFFGELGAGVVLQVNELQNEGCDATGLCSNATWGIRPSFLLLGFGARVWDPLLLDVGVRLGYGVQWRYSLSESDFRYDPGIDLVELLPFARGAVYPFGSDVWGVIGELGLGPVFAFGGKRSATDFPEETQLLVRIRFAIGAVMRWDEQMQWVLNALSFTTDISVTDQFQKAIGTVISWDPHVVFQYRF